MKKMAPLLAGTLFALQGMLSAANEKAEPTYRAESSAFVIRGKDAWTFITENRSFVFHEVLSDDGSNYKALLLLEESFHNERTDGIEGMKGNATVKGWTLEANRPRQLRWTIRETGNEGAIQERFYRVTAWGCCDTPVVYSYYNLLTGKKMYVSNSDLIEVRGDENGPLAVRYIAFGYPGLSALNQPPELQFGTDNKIAQRFSVESSRKYFEAPQIFVSTTSQNLEKSLDLRGSPMNFTIVLKYSDGVLLYIPVEGNAIRPEKAVLPQGYLLRARS